MKVSPDPRVVTGSQCTWWDSIDKAKPTALSGLPGCPQCGGVLYEFESEEKWWASVAEYVKNSGDDTYTGFVTWLRGKCYPEADVARSVYEHDVLGKAARDVESVEPAGPGEPVEVPVEQALLLDVLTMSASIAVRRTAGIGERLSFIAALQLYFERHGNLVYDPEDPELDAMADGLLKEIEDRGVALAERLDRLHSSFFN